MTLERSTDYAIIRALITHPTQYRHAGDDFSPPARDFRVNEDPRIWYIVVRADNGTPVALFTFLPQNPVCFEVHACVLPRIWGAGDSLKALTEAITGMFKSSPARRIIASIPAENRLAIRLASRAGMALYGRNERSIMKGGQLQDQVLYGINKESCQV